MDNLPEGLQVRVLEYLDFSPPSELKARQEPDLDLIRSISCTLKDVSRTSRHWRRISLPLLFKHACLRVDEPVRRTWLDCCLRSDTSLKHVEPHAALPGNTDQYHQDILRASPRRAADMDATPSNWLRQVRSANNANEHEYATKVWASRIYHASKDFLDFVTTNRLAKRILSFVLVANGMQSTKVGQLPSPILYDWRYEAAAVMWQHILSTIDSERVAIVAPPMELACFCNSFINLDAAWAFTDMDYHVLELRQNKITAGSRLTIPLPHAQLQPIPDCSVQSDIAPSSLLHLREWTAISLNEGSFLKAYGTYEYFERGPPSLISSIASLFTPWNLPTGSPPVQPALTSLRSFTYTAIFPFANHLDFREMLPQLEMLDLQLAPDPQSGILDDRKRTGRAQLEDCWQELISSYHDFATILNTFGMSRETFPRLKTFICRDVGIRGIKGDLDHIFTPLCLPVWAEYTDGVFTRIADKAERPGMDDIV